MQTLDLKTQLGLFVAVLAALLFNYSSKSDNTRSFLVPYSATVRIESSTHEFVLAAEPAEPAAHHFCDNLFPEDYTALMHCKERVLTSWREHMLQVMTVRDGNPQREHGIMAKKAYERGRALMLLGAQEEAAVSFSMALIHLRAQSPDEPSPGMHSLTGVQVARVLHMHVRSFCLFQGSELTYEALITFFLAHCHLYSGNYSEASLQFRRQFELQSNTVYALPKPATGQHAQTQIPKANAETLLIPPSHPVESAKLKVQYPLTTVERLRHDSDQLLYLLAHKLVDSEQITPYLHEYRAICHRYGIVCASEDHARPQLPQPDTAAKGNVLRLSDQEWHSISGWYNRRGYQADGARLAMANHNGNKQSFAVLNNEIDWAAVQSEYLDRQRDGVSALLRCIYFPLLLQASAAVQQCRLWTTSCRLLRLSAFDDTS